MSVLGGTKMSSNDERNNKKPWEPMKIQYLGDVAEVVQNGGGKLSPGLEDTGDTIRKPPGLETTG
jgi:hypothetical protein